MDKKFKLTNNTIEFEGKILYQIMAIKTIKCENRSIKNGELGGYIEKEENLSHEGNCWVFKESKIIGNSEITGNVRIRKSTIKDCKIEGLISISNSNISNSNISNSYKKSLSISDSNIDNCSIFDCSISMSKISNSKITKYHVSMSECYNSDISSNQILYEIIIDSKINSTNIINSSIINSNITDTTIIASAISNSNIAKSEIVVSRIGKYLNKEDEKLKFYGMTINNLYYDKSRIGPYVWNNGDKIECYMGNG